MNWIVSKYKGEWALYDKESRAYVLFGTKKSMEARAKELNSTDVKKHAKGNTIGQELMGGQPNSSKPSGYLLLEVIGNGKEIIVSDDGGKTKEKYYKSNGYSGYTLHYKGNQYEFVSSYGKGSTIRDTQNSMANKEHRAYKKKRDVVNEMESREFNKPRKKERDYVNEMESREFNRKKTKKEITAEKEALARYDKWKSEQPKPFTYTIGGL
jgi:hypothetical protein